MCFKCGNSRDEEKEMLLLFYAYKGNANNRKKQIFGQKVVNAFNAVLSVLKCWSDKLYYPAYKTPV